MAQFHEKKQDNNLLAPTKKKTLFLPFLQPIATCGNYVFAQSPS